MALQPMGNGSDIFHHSSVNRGALLRATLRVNRVLRRSPLPKMSYAPPAPSGQIPNPGNFK